MGEFYVYCHLRADSGLPFYIGKGKGSRAYNTRQRTDYWKRVVAVHGLIVEMLHVGLSEEEALRKEIEEIAWARQYYEMANLCDGGEGTSKDAQTSEKQREILTFFHTHGRFPSVCRDDERTLSNALRNYAKPSTAAYDSEFSSIVKSLGYGTATQTLAGDRVRQTKQDILQFRSVFGRFPSQQIPEEARLAYKLGAYCRQDHNSFDPAFRDAVVALGFGDKSRASLPAERKLAKQENIRRFVEEHGRFPRQRDKTEHALYVSVHNYCGKTSHCYDPDFRIWCEEHGYGARQSNPTNQTPPPGLNTSQTEK